MKELKCPGLGQCGRQQLSVVWHEFTRMPGAPVSSSDLALRQQLAGSSRRVEVGRKEVGGLKPGSQSSKLSMKEVKAERITRVGRNQAAKSACWFLAGPGMGQRDGPAQD